MHGTQLSAQIYFYKCKLRVANRNILSARHKDIIHKFIAYMALYHSPPVKKVKINLRLCQQRDFKCAKCQVFNILWVLQKRDSASCYLEFYLVSYAVNIYSAPSSKSTEVGNSKINILTLKLLYRRTHVCMYVGLCIYVTYLMSNLAGCQ
jgi:hypothetical protein